LQPSTRLQDATSLVARVLLCAIFLRSIYAKVTSFEPTLSYMESQGLPGGAIGSALLVGAIVTLMAGVSALLSGWHARVGALLLVLFLIPTTLIFHLDLDDRGEIIQLCKNVSLLGGLLMVAAYGPGRWALGARPATAVT